MTKSHERDPMLAVLDKALAMEPGEVTESMRRHLGRQILKPLQACMKRHLATQDMVRDRDAQIEQLRSQVAKLQAWKDAVPVREISSLVVKSPYFESVVSAWLDSIGVQP